MATVETVIRFKGEDDTKGATNSIKQGMDTIAKGAKVAGAALTAMGVAGLAAMSEVIPVAGDFEEALRVLTVNAGEGAEMMGTFRDAAIAVGKDTELVGVSAKSAAEAMDQFFRSGLSTTEVLGDVQGVISGTTPLVGALRSAIDLAAASEVSLAESTDIIINAMSNFGIEASDTSRVTESFVRAADASIATVAELGDALKNVGSTFGAFNFTLEDTNTALALLAQHGIRGAEAGTALKSMFSNMMRQTPQVTAAMDELGLSLFNSSGTMKDLPTIIKDLSQSMFGQAKITKTVGGATKEMASAAKTAERQIPALTSTISGQERELQLLNRELQNVTSEYGYGSIQADRKRLAIQRLTDRIQKNRFQYEDAQSAIHSYSNAHEQSSTTIKTLTDKERTYYIQQIFGMRGMTAANALLKEGAAGWNSMKGAMSQAASVQDKIAARTEGWNGAMERMNDAVETLKISLGSFIIEALTPLVDDYITPIISAFTDWNESTGGLASKILAIGTAFSVVGGAVLLFIGFLPAIISGLSAIAAGAALAFAPILAIGTAIAAIVLGVKQMDVDWTEVWERMKATTLDLWERLKEWSLSAWEWIKSVWSELQPWFSDAWTWMTEAAVFAWGLVRAAAVSTWTTIKEAWKEFRPTFDLIWIWLLNTAPIAWLKLKAVAWEFANAMAAIWEFIKPYVIGFIVWFGEEMSAFWTWLTAEWNKLEPYFTSLWNTIKEKAAAFRVWWEDHWLEIKSGLEIAWSLIIGILELAWNVISGLFKIFVVGLKGDWSDTWEEIKSVGLDIWNDLRDRADEIWAEFAGTVKIRFEEAKKSATDETEKLQDGVKGKIQELAKWLATDEDLANSFGQAGVNWFVAIKDAITDWFNSTFRAFMRMLAINAAMEFANALTMGMFNAAREFAESQGWFSEGGGDGGHKYAGGSDYYPGGGESKYSSTGGGGLMGGTTNNMTIGSIPISINGAQDPQATATAVENILLNLRRRGGGFAGG